MSQSNSPARPLNIYDAIAANKRRSVWLIIVLVAIPAVLAEVFGLALGLPPQTAGVVAGLAGAVALIVALWGYRFGDGFVLSVSEAQPADRSQYTELYQVVEQLSLGLGIPVPKVYVVNDPAPNAFATGRDAQHASICVTSGLLERMTKAELEGVIGHELSHIGNLDIRVMLITAVLVGVIAIMVDVLLRATWFGAGTRSRYQDRGNNAGGAILLVGAVVALILAPLVSRAIQMAVSRQREYLADASSALLTRNPEELATALEKIASDPHPLDIATKGTAHLFIAEPLKGHDSSLNSLFDTHPPIQERIKRLRAMEGRV